MSATLVCELFAFEAGVASADAVADIAADVLLTEWGTRDLEAEAALELAGFPVNGRLRRITTCEGVIAY
jgi:hypothetical protein